MTSLLFNPGLWCLIWAMSCYTYPLMTNSVSWLRTKIEHAHVRERRNQLKCCVVWQDCVRGDKKERDQTPLLAFVFTEWESAWCGDRRRIYVCMQGAGTLGNFFLFFHPFAHLWSRPGFEVILGEGRGIKAKQKSRQVHVATRTHKKCNLHNLFFKLFKCEEMTGSLGAWQPIRLDKCN